MIFGHNQRQVVLLSIIAVILALSGIVYWRSYDKDASDINNVNQSMQDSIEINTDNVKTKEEVISELEETIDNTDNQTLDQNDIDNTDNQTLDQNDIDDIQEIDDISTTKEKLITDIIVNGNSRVLSRVIVAYSGLNVNDTVTESELVAAIGRVFDSNYFDTVNISLQDDGVLNLLVHEKPIVHKVRILNINPQEKTIILHRLKVKSRNTFDESDLQKDIAAIEQGFRVSGQFNTKVTAKVIELSNNRVDVEYLVNKGSIPLIREIEIMGNQSIPDKVLKSLLMVKAQSWLPGFSKIKSYLLPELINTSSGNISNYYEKFGFPYATVTSIVAEIDRVSNNFLLTFVLDEGNYYEFGKSSIQLEDGKDIFLSVDQKNAILQESLQLGTFYSKTQLQKVKNVITKSLRKFGYSEVKIDVNTKPDHNNQIMDVDFVVKKLVRRYVRRINISGNILSPSYVILHRLLFKEGDIFNSALLQHSIAKLRASGNFQEVSSVTNNVGTNQVDVEIRIKHLKYRFGNLNITIGADKNHISHSLRLINQNLLGSGRTLILEAKLPFGGNFRDDEDKIDLNTWLDGYTNIDSKQLSFSSIINDPLTIPGVTTVINSSWARSSDDNIFAYRGGGTKETSNWKDAFEVTSRFILNVQSLLQHQLYHKFSRTNTYFKNDAGDVKIHCSITTPDNDVLFMIADNRNSCLAIGGLPIDPSHFTPSTNKIIQDFWDNESYGDFLVISDVFGNSPGIEYRSSIGYAVGSLMQLSGSKNPLTAEGKFDLELIGIQAKKRIFKLAKLEFAGNMNKRLSNVLKFQADLNFGVIVSFDDLVVPYNMRYSLGGLGFPGFESHGISPRLQLGEVLNNKDLSSSNDTNYKFIGGNAFYKVKIGLHSPLFFPEDYGVNFSLNMNLGSAFYVDPNIKKAYNEAIETDSIYPRISLSLEVSWQGPFGHLTVGYGWSIKYQENDERTNWIFNVGASI